LGNLWEEVQRKKSWLWERLEDEFSSFFGQNMLWQSHGGSFGAYHICIVAKYLKLQARFLLQNST
jgi:hypothetical protein